MIIGISGYGCSGASAVKDYIKGFKDISVQDFTEFQLLHQPDGINDLKYHLTQSKERIAVNVAVKRFIRSQKKGFFAWKMRKKLGKKYKKWVDEYINEIIQVSWKGESSTYDPSDISNKPKTAFFYRLYRGVEKLFRKWFHSFHIAPYQNKYLSIMSEKDFDEITKKHLKKLFDLLGMVSKVIVVDMLFSATNPTLGMEFFNDVKNINVMRDPRDVYVYSKRRREFSRFMPNDKADNFVVYYKALNEQPCEDSRNLNVQYEDLIYKYEETAEKIRRFIGLDRLPENEFKFFDPTFSVKYTNRKKEFEIYPEDVEYIKNNLSEYIYDFDSAIRPEEVGSIIKRKELCKAEYSGLLLK